MSKKVVLIDYQLSNLFSVQHACEKVGLDAEISSDYHSLLEADGAILPGVGAFGDAMNNLIQLDLISPILDFIASGKPFMGICLGMQLLFSESEEFGVKKGLDIFDGVIRKFPSSLHMQGLKIPQISWNTITPPSKKTWHGTPLEVVGDREYMYFVHSFYADAKNSADVLSKTTYGDCTYCSSIARNNIFAAQFHPEKSGEKGLQIYRKWGASLIA